MDQRVEQRAQAVRVVKTANEILETLAAYLGLINDSGHGESVGRIDHIPTAILDYPRTGRHPSTKPGLART